MSSSRIVGLDQIYHSRDTWVPIWLFLRCGFGYSLTMPAVHPLVRYTTRCIIKSYFQLCASPVNKDFLDGRLLNWIPEMLQCSQIIFIWIPWEHHNESFLAIFSPLGIGVLTHGSNATENTKMSLLITSHSAVNATQPDYQGILRIMRNPCPVWAQN